MFKLFFAIIALVLAAVWAGTAFGFNATIPIFVILGIGCYLVCRIGGPVLPDAPVWGSGHGIFLRSKDYGHAGDDGDGDEAVDQREGDGFR